MIKTILLSTAQKELPYKTKRTFIKWCLKNGVGILPQLGVKNQFLIEEEFNAARMKPILKYLKEKHGERLLPDILRAYINVGSDYLIAINSIYKNKVSTKSNSLGSKERNFLERLTNINPEL